MTPTPTSAFDPAAEAAAHQAASGPIADLARGRQPACFAALRQTLAAQIAEGRAAAAMMGMHDDSGEAFWDAGENEVAQILGSVTALHGWASEQTCAPAQCECRADRLLRRQLEALRLPVCSGYLPGRPGGRAVAVLVGNVHTADGPVRPVQVSHRGSIDHMVREHRGWHARLRTADGLETVYQSPLYPLTAVEDYLEDTAACARAIAAALR